jgi:capsular polysaccharide biosynthesis protein
MNKNSLINDLTFQIAENATIFPCQYNKGKPYSGIFDSEDKIVHDSLLFREKFGQIIFPIEKNTPVQNVFEGTYIFAGYLIGHYGHFLLESLARLWYIKQYPQLPIIWIKHNQGSPYLRYWQEEIMSLLGVKNQQIFLEKPSLVKKIIIPQPGCILWGDFALQQAEALTVLTAKEPIKGQKIWLSRSQLNPKNPSFIIYNEKQLEDILESQGWFIFHAQNYTVKEQIEMLANAEQIAGFQGSAFHTLVFLPQNAKTRISILGRRVKIVAGCKLVQNIETYTAIARTKGLKQTEYPVTQTKIANLNLAIGLHETFIIHSYKEIIDLLNNTGV